ncbi:MAG: MmcQ/YjbR family DNA-binding protein [Flavobacteriales bacterium]|jgi:predicted DNA-binding protein (MmcQ/YjbR family)|nr:MAG: MmcQ/YjbR family DNA-binding protein [Flavobacteriales bacterium]
MTIEELQAHCSTKSGVSWDAPFGPDVLVFRVAGKIFALAPLDVFATINLKCDPERAIELRERYPGIVPGYHMNKRHWNTVEVTGSVPRKLLLELVDHSYALVRASLPKKVREQLD